jgi:hypothetical protein
MADLPSQTHDLEPHFNFLRDRLKENYADYSQYVFTTTATILLIIGWLLTSKDARAYISEHRWIRWPMVGAIFLFWLAEIWFSHGAFDKSKRITDLIVRVLNDHPDITEGYVLKDQLPDPKAVYYLSHVTPVEGVVVFVAAHAVLYVVLILIIWSLFSPVEKRRPS